MTLRKRLPGTPAPMHYWEGHNGVPIAGDSWGDPDGPLVVLSHGIGQTRHSWKGTGELLGNEGFHVVSYDARGHGDSGWCDSGDYTREAMIGDLQYLLKALGRNDPYLVGASMGGATSMIAIGEGHVDAQALVLVDIVPHIEKEGVGKISNFLEEHLGGFDSLEQAADAIQKYRPRAKRPKNLNGLAKNVRQGSDGRYYWHWDPGLSGRERDAEQRRVAAARQLSVPTLLVRGAQSDVVSDDSVDKFLALTPAAEYVNVEGARHMITGDKNDVFGSALIDFLKKHSFVES